MKEDDDEDINVDVPSFFVHNRPSRGIPKVLPTVSPSVTESLSPCGNMCVYHG